MTGSKSAAAKSGQRRRKSSASVTEVPEPSQVASCYALTGELAADLAAVAEEQGVECMPPVRVVLMPRVWGEPEPPLAATEAADESPEPPPPPPPPPDPYQERLQAITEKYQFYRPQVRLQLRASLAQRDSETGQLAARQPAHGLLVKGWRCEADHLAAMRRCLASQETLTTLTLQNAALDEPAITALAALLAERPHVTSVSLDNNPGVGALAPLLLPPSSGLLSLSLRGCRVTDADVAALEGPLSALSDRADLKFNSVPLRSLSLANNRVTDAGAATLARVLRCNRQLATLSLTSNQVGTAGAAALAAVLQPFELTHEEVVAGRRARAQVRQLLTERVKSELLKTQPCCAGAKCTHTRREESGDRAGAASPGRSVRSSSRQGKPMPRGGSSSRPAVSLPAPPSTEESVAEQMETVTHPLMTEVRAEAGRQLSPGNLVLASLNLAYNAGVGPEAAAAFLEALRYQETVPAPQATRLGRGLQRLVLTGTPADRDRALAALLLRRQPALSSPEPPPEEDERSRSARPGKASEASLSTTRRNTGRAGKQKGRKGK